MKPLFYYFGIGKDENSFNLTDPIIIKDKFIVIDPTEFYLENPLGVDKVNLIKEFTIRRGILFAVSKNNKKDVEFIRMGKLISPNIKEKEFSIFFLNNEKSILFKIYKNLKELEEPKEEILKIIKPLNLISEKEFKIKIKDWKHSDPEDYRLSLTTNKFKLSAGNIFYLFICIQTNNYNRLKDKVKTIYKGERDLKTIKHNL